MVASTWNKGWRQPWTRDAQRSNAKDTALCLATLQQAGGKTCVLATRHAKHRGDEPRLPMPGMETIKIYLLAGVFLLRHAQDICSNLASEHWPHWGIYMASMLHPWPGLRGAWLRLRVRDFARAHLFSPHTTYL